MEKRIQFKRRSYAKEHTSQFWIRFFAFGIDMQLIWICVIPSYLFLDDIGIPEGHHLFGSSNFQLGTVITLLTFVLYFTLFEQSKWKGSIGKIFMKLSVTDMNDERLTFTKSLFRNSLKIPSILTIIGVYMIDATKHKQSLHDLLTRTKVSRK